MNMLEMDTNESELNRSTKTEMASHEITCEFTFTSFTLLFKERLNSQNQHVKTEGGGSESRNNL